MVPPLDLGGEGGGQMEILEESPEEPIDVPSGITGGEAFETVSRGRLGSLRF